VVWRRIAVRIAPPPKGRPVGLVMLHGAAALSVFLVLVMALGGRRDEGGPAPPRAYGVGAWAAPVAHGLSAAELAIQPAFVRRPTDLTMPLGPAARRLLMKRACAGRCVGALFDPPREAYNRALWLRPAPEPRSGPARPLVAVNGL